MVGKVGAVIQARINSQRFPGKVLLSLPYGSGTSIIENIIKCVLAVPRIDTVIVATSLRSENDSIISVAREAGAEVIRGSEDDVLERFHKAAVAHGLAQIVRLTADNPFVDSALLNACLEKHGKAKAEYTKTVGLPQGMNFEIISFLALDRLQRSVRLSDEREHVTLHVNRNPKKFAMNVLDLGKPECKGLRLTIDRKTDYALACFIFEYLNSTNQIINLANITRLFQKYPWAKLINSDFTKEQ